MKIIGEMKSKHGHDKHNYLISITPKELFVVRSLAKKNGSPPEKHDQREIERNSFRSVQQFFRNLVIREGGKIITKL